MLLGLGDLGRRSWGIQGLEVRFAVDEGCGIPKFSNPMPSSPEPCNLGLKKKKKKKKEF